MRLITIASILALSWCPRCWSHDPVDVPPRILYCDGVDEFSEMQFFPGGKAVQYYFTLNEQSVPLKRRGYVPPTVYPFMTVCSFTWELRNNRIYIGRKLPNREFQYDEKEDRFWRGEHFFRRQFKVQWFDRLTEYAGDPSLGGRQKSDLGGKKGGTSHSPFRLLHRKTNDGFVEYEFRGDGTALIYRDTENAPDREEHDSVYDLPLRFSVELVPFKVKGQQVEIDHGDQIEVVRRAKSGKIQSSDGSEWEPIDHLEFVSRVYAYCERRVSQ